MVSNLGLPGRFVCENLCKPVNYCTFRVLTQFLWVFVLQGTLSKEEIENLLRHGAYDIFNEEKAGDGEAASNAFVEQDIDSILERHSRTVIHENTGSRGKAASTFSKATFSATTPGTNREVEEVDIEDPDFWKKIVGEGTENDADDGIVYGRRQRVQANYSERAYSQQLNEHIALGGDVSDSDGDNEVDDLYDNGSHERARWGGTAPNEWKKEDVESVIRSLSTFGYGIVSWADLIPRLQLSKDYGTPEVCATVFWRV
jgi:hypothetical protein